MRVIERGTPPDGTATLVLANHVSWLDIPVIGSLRPLSFIAKSEVEGWPVVGLFARLQRIRLHRPRPPQGHRRGQRGGGPRLADGDVIVLFPEGTTSDGNRVLPFRSSLVGAARAALAEPAAGPATSSRSRSPTRAATACRSPAATGPSSPGTATWTWGRTSPAFLGDGPLDVMVTWGEPIPFDGDRKRATALAEAAVRRAIHAGGREGPHFSRSAQTA